MEFIYLENLKGKTFPTFNEVHLSILREIDTLEYQERVKRILLTIILVGQILQCDTKNKSYYFTFKDENENICFELSNQQLTELFRSKKSYGSKIIKPEELSKTLSVIKQTFTKEITLRDDSKLILFDDFTIIDDGIEGKINKDFIYLLNNHSNNDSKEFYDKRVGEYIQEYISLECVLDFSVKELMLYSIISIRYNYQRDKIIPSIWKIVNKYIFANYSDTTPERKRVQKLNELKDKLNKKMGGEPVRFDITYKKVGRKNIVKEVIPWKNKKVEENSIEETEQAVIEGQKKSNTNGRPTNLLVNIYKKNYKIYYKEELSKREENKLHFAIVEFFKLHCLDFKNEQDTDWFINNVLDGLFKKYDELGYSSVEFPRFCANHLKTFAIENIINNKPNIKKKSNKDNLTGVIDPRFEDWSKDIRQLDPDEMEEF